MSQTDSSFFKILVLIIGGLFAFMIVIIIIANMLTDGSRAGDPGDDNMVQDAIEQRIAPIGKVNVGTATAAAPAAAQPAATATPAAAPAAAPAGGAADGKAIYTQACFACHGTGAAGAPKLGDKAAWEARIAQGKDTLYSHALGGFKAMPPKGGNMSLTDADVKAAVDYLVANSQ